MALRNGSGSGLGNVSARGEAGAGEEPRDVVTVTVPVPEVPLDIKESLELSRRRFNCSCSFETVVVAIDEASVDCLTELYREEDTDAASEMLAGFRQRHPSQSGATMVGESIGDAVGD